MKLGAAPAAAPAMSQSPQEFGSAPAACAAPFVVKLGAAPTTFPAMSQSPQAFGSAPAAPAFGSAAGGQAFGSAPLPCAAPAFGGASAPKSTLGKASAAPSAGGFSFKTPRAAAWGVSETENKSGPTGESEYELQAAWQRLDLSSSVDGLFQSPRFNREAQHDEENENYRWARRPVLDS